MITGITITNRRQVYVKNLTWLTVIITLFLVGCKQGPDEKPGKSRYEMQAVLDTSQLIMDCNLTIQWHNTSQTPVSEIPVKFMLDSGHTLLKKVLVNDQQPQVKYVSPEDQGFEGFVMQVNTPLQPGSHADIKLNFKTAKNRYYRNRLLGFTEELPLIPYLNDNGFNPHFQVHSDYKVTVTYPELFKLASTGWIDYKETKGGLTTAKLEAQSVPWFGVIFLKDVLLKEATSAGVLIRSFYTEDDAKWGKKLLEYSKHIIKFYRDTLGFYPQKHIDILPGSNKPNGGWPICPNVVGIHRGLDLKGERAAGHAEWIMAHEIGHQYWGFNYVLEPLNYPQWFGIGMGIYTDWLYTVKYRVNKNHNTHFFYSYTKGVSDSLNTTIMQTVQSLDEQGFDWNNVIKHGKAWAVLRLLAYELGEEVFFQIFKHCLDNYGGINVTLEMFKQDCERISQRNLDDFFQTWFHTNDYLQYRIVELKKGKSDSNSAVSFTIKKTGQAAFPNIDIDFVLENDQTIREQFDGSRKMNLIEKTFDAPVKEIRLDPDRKLPLVGQTGWEVE